MGSRPSAVPRTRRIKLEKTQRGEEPTMGRPSRRQHRSLNSVSIPPRCQLFSSNCLELAKQHAFPNGITSCPFRFRHAVVAENRPSGPHLELTTPDNEHKFTQFRPPSPQRLASPRNSVKVGYTSFAIAS